MSILPDWHYGYPDVSAPQTPPPRTFLESRTVQGKRVRYDWATERDGSSKLLVFLERLSGRKGRIREMKLVLRVDDSGPHDVGRPFPKELLAEAKAMYKIAAVMET